MDNLILSTDHRKEDWKADVSSVVSSVGHLSEIRSDKGLTLETSAFESFCGCQFTLSTQLMKPNYTSLQNIND